MDGSNGLGWITEREEPDGKRLLVSTETLLLTEEKKGGRGGHTSGLCCRLPLRLVHLTSRR